MVLTKKKKVAVIEKYSGALKDATMLLFVNFHGLSVEKSTRLRKELRAAGIGYNVIKKTLLKRILDSFGFTDIPRLTGEVGVAYGSGDATEIPRLVSKFIKREKEGLAILGGVYESKFAGEDVMKRLASIPPREVLLTQLAFMLTQPVASFARSLEEVRKKSTE